MKQMKQEGEQAALVFYPCVPEVMRTKREEGLLAGNCAGRPLQLEEHRGEDQCSQQPPGSNPTAPFCTKKTRGTINWVSYSGRLPSYTWISCTTANEFSTVCSSKPAK